MRVQRIVSAQKDRKNDACASVRSIGQRVKAVVVGWRSQLAVEGDAETEELVQRCQESFGGRILPRQRRWCEPGYAGDGTGRSGSGMPLPAPAPAPVRPTRSHSRQMASSSHWRPRARPSIWDATMGASQTAAMLGKPSKGKTKNGTRKRNSGSTM